MLCPLSCLCVPCVSVPEPRRSSALHSLCVVDLSRIVLCSVPPFVCTLFVLSARKVSFAVVKRRRASRGRGSTCWGGQTEAYRHSTSLRRWCSPRQHTDQFCPFNRRLGRSGGSRGGRRGNSSGASGRPQVHEDLRARTRTYSGSPATTRIGIGGRSEQRRVRGGWQRRHKESRSQGTPHFVLISL
jgi:hypothetical protein